ncbi:Unannotated [Lentimonas sp. CC4]|nr:Unannotated [Lentimonas sp. CC4]CAA6685489.1 Unannotated [Lentimonas sp. CC6]CAA7076937.1 Unannotated [Lentimonas sp. CC4]CAA7170488.1 Unannotated [Lentimonas sp. CC21]CAA7179816.1 Unannotated [Lentimonas sp. CC8]
MDCASLFRRSFALFLKYFPVPCVRCLQASAVMPRDGYTSLGFFGILIGRQAF